VRQDPHLGGHDGRAEKVGGHRIGVLVPRQDLHQPGVRMTTVCKDISTVYKMEACLAN
jgi:hypothetical protein